MHQGEGHTDEMKKEIVGENKYFWTSIRSEVKQWHRAFCHFHPNPTTADQLFARSQTITGGAGRRRNRTGSTTVTSMASRVSRISSPRSRS
jgi:hypothetical protein